MQWSQLIKFESYEVLLLVFGLAFLGASILPQKLRNSFLSLPMVYIAVGFFLAFFWDGDPVIDTTKNGMAIEKLTEFAVILSLMSAGLKIDKDLSFKGWATTWRLLSITMLFCIIVLSFFGWSWLNMAAASALLLGAAMAPTDPVMAADVQVDKPGEGHEDEVRFSLTSEAGLNDGLAFPFVYLAIFLAMGQTSFSELGTWFLFELLWKVVAGGLVGYLSGRFIGFLFFRWFNHAHFHEGFVVVAITFVAYGFAELAQAYGFIAVFVAGFFFRRTEKKHKYHKELHDFSVQLEHLILAVLMILFGIILQQGVLQELNILGIIIALGFVLIVRPLGGMLGLIGRKIPLSEKFYISFLGIRGIGSFYYISYALNNAPFPQVDAKKIWAVAGAIVLVSVVLHGIYAPKIIKNITSRYTFKKRRIEDRQ